MIINWVFELQGTSGFQVTPEDYDGTPYISDFLMDVSPKARHWDREAVAAFLVFGRTFGGPVTMPHKFSPAVSNAIKSMALPVQLDLQPIEYYPTGLPIGERKLHILVDEKIPDFLLHPKDQSLCYLEILPSDKISGSIRRINGLSIASNAWLHASEYALEEWYPYIAIACLFAEDLDAATIVLPSHVKVDAAHWLALCNLLATARLGLEIAK